MWKKGKDILSLGDNLMKRDKRYDLVKGKNGNTLVIRLAESSDAGEFECELPNNDRASAIRHNIAVRGKLLSRNRLPAIMSWINIDQVGENFCNAFFARNQNGFEFVSQKEFFLPCNVTKIHQWYKKLGPPGRKKCCNYF